MLKRIMSLMTKNKKGFTLVELMVVVVIIGVLTAIAVPVYNNSVTQAQTAACDANKRMIEGAIQQHVLNNIDNIVNDENGNIDYQTIDLDVLLGEYFAETPECPAGGTYDIDDNGIVTCTKH